MFRLYFGLFILALLAVPVGLLVAYVVWMVKTWRRGRKCLFWGQTTTAALSVAALVFLFDLTPASHEFWHWQRMKVLSGHTADWTGIPFEFAKNSFWYDSSRCWNGDGRTVIVLELPPETIRYFSTPTPDFFAHYPKETASWKDWQIVHWRTGPPKSDEKRILDFAFIEGDTNEMAQLNKPFKAARRALVKPTTSYAYIYRYPAHEHPSDIYLFVIDPEEQLFYLINLNT